MAKRTEYNLSKVKALAHRALDGENSAQINGNAINKAREDFNFETTDILKTFKKLSGNQFVKKMPSECVPGVMLDVYITRYLDESIYTHFYIKIIDNEEVLVINSFHAP